MDPIRTAFTECVYRGPTSDIGDLWCQRIEPGVIASVWRPSPEELELLAAGGAVRLTIFMEPIPPVSLDVLSPELSVPVAEHPFKVIPELQDPERA